MKIEFKLNSVQVIPEKYDFNWAKVSFSRLNPDGDDVDISINLEIKVPKKYDDLKNIKNYAFGRALDEVRQCAQFFSGEQHRS
jgi:hypothetical protein